MTDDRIVRMLRVSGSDPVQQEAADEIERLRAEIDAAKRDNVEQFNALMFDVEAARAERDALRTQLTEARKELRQIEADCEADYPPSPGSLKYAIRDVLKMIKGGGNE